MTEELPPLLPPAQLDFRRGAVSEVPSSTPLIYGYLVGCLLAMASCATHGATTEAPSVPAVLLLVCCSPLGQIALASLAFGIIVAAICTLLHIVFGTLRAVEYQRFWDRLAHVAIVELVTLGAVVEPDSVEITFSAAWAVWCTVCSLFLGLCRDRFEHMAHRPQPPTRTAVAAVACLALALIAAAGVAAIGGAVLLREADMSGRELFLFRAFVLVAEGGHTLLQVGQLGSRIHLVCPSP